ncbi:hypothetical protein QTP70_008754 [Hemibagrus guttatus]|uniref:ribonuclease H n=1 Tax=Hemibagrus guttatus TaxID=175788 RepID=A0AAE0QSD8_9TELE|nr:hypothetical protein QTP70_008754 [Hemibagrus guttatus]
MRIVSTNFIPDRSRPGLTTTAIGAVDLQGAGGNWATVGRRSRGGRRVRRQREKRKVKSVGLRIGTLNVGTMTGKGRELADVMERRKVDILCVQETRWKGSKARSIGAGFKLFYYGVDSKTNGVGVVLKEEFVRNVLEVKRVSDRVMSLKLEIEGVMLNVVSGYAPQVGCELEEKERFWSELDEVMESIPTGERVVIGADFNGHVGEGNTGDEEVMGKFGVKERNLEGQMVVDFAKRMDMGVVNTYFQKREEHRVTYKSGGRRTQVDYILCRRGNLKEISDCKVVVGESVARQHRMVVCRMTLMVCKTKRSKIEKKTKWWKLKKEECCEEFRQKLRQALGGQVVLPDDWETTAEVIRETGRKVLGVSSGRRKEDKETWWWNEEVQDSIQRKRLAKKKWDMDRTEENRQEYKELQRRVKREVSKAKQKAYEELYTRLDTREGEKDLYRLARQRDRDGKDMQQVRVIKDRDGRVLTSEESVQRRWKEYFEELMNEENEREKRVEGVNSVEQKVDKIRKDEVRKALKRMKSGKAVGPDDIPVEVWKCLGEAAVEFLANLFNRVLESERMPEEWRRSVLVPIFKNKGDVQSCSNYRGIKLMSHTMKVWERVVEARLRKVVEICEQQYGFMPRKSTTDAIFALRILMEKYRDGQKELHCVFVDLEKAYDRVPREELWYCMRKSGVAEKYVRVVQDMYERSRTVVRCAVGQTEEFNVEVGLHQGSALSPFLFAMVMDQLSEEVRQESPWTMMFADDIVICSESREQVEENLERWRFALERRGMKVSRSKTEYMCVNEREGSGTVRLQGEEVKKVQEFKYLGSTVQSNGECGKEVKKRVQAGWNGWRKVSGVLCDQKISARIKGKVYRTVVRPAMLYGLETVSLRKRQEPELEVAELKMLRFSLGVTRLDRIRNEYIRGTAHVGRLGDKVREARLRWFGHVQRRDRKGRELADMMERRKVDILCVQETRWKGSKARSIGAGFKLFYYGVDSKRNGVGVVLKEELVGCELEEKERFWSELDEVMESIPTGDEEVMGKFGVKERNLEGQMVVDFAKRMDMAVVNTYFQKREEHRVTYKSGGRRTQKKRQKLRQALGGQVVLPDDWETTAEVIRETGRKDSIQRKRLAKKKWDMDRTEENRQEYKELQRRVKREVSKAKQKAYDELYTRVLTSEESVQRRWKEYFEELMNEENEREKRVEGVNSVEQKVDKIRKDEVRKALKRMKSGKAVGPDDIPVDVWKCLGEAAVEFLASLFNRVLESERMPEEWRRSVLVPIFKNKGDVQSCSNYRGIKLMSHTMKVWERVVEARLRKVVEICEQQYGFMPRKSTTDAIFALRILMEKYRDGQRELHCVFVDLEKAYDRVPREELWYCMRKSGVAEKYVRVVQDMYERSRTVVRCAVGQTKEFNVEVGLHQGSALSPFLFAIVMDQLSEEVRQESPWTMMFADDIVICSESREQVEENLERWRFALERRGMKVSRSKTEYMCVNEREGSGTVRLQGEEVKKVQEFKYLGSTVQSNGECRKEVKKRVQAGWNGWRKVSGVLCDQKISARIKGKVYRTVVRPAMLYGLETVSLRKRQESELEVAELKMLRFSLGVTRLDRIRNEYIRGTAHVGRLGDKVREARLRWFGHVQRREAFVF